MSKAEDFIKDCTRHHSNAQIDANDLTKEVKVLYFHEWLGPDQALRAVEIAREELIDKACEWLKSYRQDTPDGTGYVDGIVNDKTIEEFKQAMEE